MAFTPMELRADFDMHSVSKFLVLAEYRIVTLVDYIAFLLFDRQNKWVIN